MLQPMLYRHNRQAERATSAVTNGGWQAIGLLDETQFQVWLQEAEQLWRTAEHPRLEQHPGRLLPAQKKIVALEIRDIIGLSSYVLVEMSRKPVVLRLGEFKLASIPVTHVEINGGIVGHSFGANNAWSGLLDALPSKFARLPVRLNSLPLSMLEAEVLSAPTLRQRFFIMRSGRHQRHYGLLLPQTFEEYIKALPPKYRQNVRRLSRNLEISVGGELRFVTFREPKEVSEFMNLASAISRVTYQYRLLKSGLFEREECFREYSNMAARGVWRGHLLYCRDEPVAFMTGCHEGTNYYGLETGYNPKWARLSVGRVAFYYLVKSLIESKDPPKRLDFCRGDQDWKRRTANLEWIEGSYVLVPNRSPTFVIFLIGAFFERLTEVLAGFLSRFGVKERVRSFLRKGISQNLKEKVRNRRGV